SAGPQEQEAAMLYDPERDLYVLIGVSADASLEEIRAAIARRRGRPVDQAAEVLLDVARRTRYDASRALHRVSQLIAFDRVRSGVSRGPWAGPRAATSGREPAAVRWGRGGRGRRIERRQVGAVAPAVPRGLHRQRYGRLVRRGRGEQPALVDPVATRGQGHQQQHHHGDGTPASWRPQIHGRGLIDGRGV